MTDNTLDSRADMNDLEWMQQAILLARKAEALGEVPVGAVLIRDGQVIGSGMNQVISYSDPCAHAEILAIREGGQTDKNYRLVNTTLYVTLEPCVMCLGAIMHARITRVVFGASDPKTGACGGCSDDLTHHPSFFHKLIVEGPVMQDECGQQLSDFFKRRRADKKE